MPVYFVISQETCQQCGGNGVYSSYADEYREFNEASRAKERELRESGQIDANNNGHQTLVDFDNEWWASRGFPGGVNHWPVDECECEECDGHGKITKQVPLSDAINKLIEGGEIRPTV